MSERLAPAIERLHGLVAQWSNRILILERAHGLSRSTRSKKMMGQSAEEEIHLLLERAKTEFAEGRAERAEQTYIDVLRLDPRNVEAYWGLVRVYRELRTNRETLETLHFLTRLLPEDAEVWYELARESLALENHADALEAIQRAVSLEGANPKYLDFLCEAAILSKRRDVALDAFRRLEAGNPDNAKLSEFRKRINEL
jgi:general transcription factor 3C polypeptide 3 (transcription factor C subunit 4)